MKILLLYQKYMEDNDLEYDDDNIEFHGKTMSSHKTF